MIEISNANGGILLLNDLPEECPHCHSKIVPNPLFSYVAKWQAEVFMYCPGLKCQSSFIAYYSQNVGKKGYFFRGKTSQGTMRKITFPDLISTISPTFVNIFNQSNVAEYHKLIDVCGVGYRKALEFLIKDYAIVKHSVDAEKIAKMLLGQCIDKYIDNDKIKGAAKRAVWLGNDETHYVRKWENKTIEDLKKLIHATVYWIELQELTDRLDVEMPDK